MLQKFLQGTSRRGSERALFVLAQSSSPEARKVITDIARGNANPDLQRKAIQYIGMTGRGENRQVLSEIYQSTTDVDVKRQILRAYMVSGDRERVLAAATGEKAPELRQEAVRQLGVMGAREELRQLYQKETTVEVKRQILQALFVGGDADPAHRAGQHRAERRARRIRRAWDDRACPARARRSWPLPEGEGWRHQAHRCRRSSSRATRSR
jgi:hypothetical protein